MRLLLIDDDLFVRDMYTLQFEHTGHEVVVADNASVALSILNHDKDFDCLLIDMIMPGDTGIDLLRIIKQQFPDLKAKRIMLSNQNEHYDIEEATGAGALGYIVKANTVPSEVVKKVTKIIEDNK